MSKIALVITTYNRTSYLKRAIESVYTFGFDDIILVDDGSSEENFATIENILVDYPKINCIRHPKNMGLGEARNTGIKASKTDWITFLDDDDFYTKNPINDLKKFINDNPNTDIIHFKIELRNKKQDSSHTYFWGYENFTLEELVNYNRLSGNSLIKKSMWKKLNGFKPIPFEDWEFWIRAKKNKYNFKFFDDVFYLRDVVDTSLQLQTELAMTDMDWKIKYLGIDLIKKSRNKDIGLGITTFCRDTYLFNLIESNLKHLQEFKMYIVDQGEHSIEKDALYEKLQRLGHEVVYLPFDSGISKARRILKEICKEEFLVYMEDDFKATYKTNLYLLKEILDENPTIGVVGGNLEGCSATGAYSYFFNRVDDKILYFPLDYLVWKKLAKWETTSKGTSFIRADIVSDFTMWRREVPNIFDDNVKTIEHTHVYLLVKYKTKYKVAFCPSPEIKHTYLGTGSETKQYLDLRTRKEDFNYLKKYWNIVDFCVFDKQKLIELESIHFNTCPKESIQNLTIKPNILAIPTTDSVQEVITNKPINSKVPKETVMTIINYLNQNNINYWLLNVSCLESVTKKDIVSNKLYIGVNSDKNKELILNALEEYKDLLDITVEKNRKTKPAQLYDLHINVPVPVVAYLEKTFKQNWEELKNG